MGQGATEKWSIAIADPAFGSGREGSCCLSWSLTNNEIERLKTCNLSITDRSAASTNGSCVCSSFS